MLFSLAPPITLLPFARAVSRSNSVDGAVPPSTMQNVAAQFLNNVLSVLPMPDVFFLVGLVGCDDDVCSYCSLLKTSGTSAFFMYSQWLHHHGNEWRAYILRFDMELVNGGRPTTVQ